MSCWSCRTGSAPAVPCTASLRSKTTASYGHPVLSSVGNCSLRRVWRKSCTVKCPEVLTSRRGRRWLQGLRAEVPRSAVGGCGRMWLPGPGRCWEGSVCAVSSGCPTLCLRRPGDCAAGKVVMAESRHGVGGNTAVAPTLSTALSHAKLCPACTCTACQAASAAGRDPGHCFPICALFGQIKDA